LGTPLGSLSHLEEISGVLLISGNSALASIDGFDALKTAGQIDISGNHALVSIDGFDALESVTHALALQVRINNSLEALAGFTNLNHIYGSLLIEWNPKLPTCAAENFACAIETIDGGFSIDSNDDAGICE